MKPVKKRTQNVNQLTIKSAEIHLKLLTNNPCML